MFTIKEKRLVFLTKDLVELLETGGFRCKEFKKITIPQMSICSWLKSAGVSKEIRRNILDMHLKLNDTQRKHYNMVVTKKDILCDFHFVTLTGEKK
jgi:hypothetical protein